MSKDLEIKIIDLIQTTELKDTAVFPMSQDGVTYKVPQAMIESKVLEKGKETFIDKTMINVQDGVTGFNPLGKVAKDDNRAVSGDAVFRNINESAKTQTPILKPFSQYNSELTEGWTYMFLSLEYQNANNIDSVNVIAKNNGRLDVVFIAVNGNLILHSIPFDATTGFNTIKVNNPIVSQPFYLGIRTITAKMATNHPANGTLPAMMRLNSDQGGFTDLAYDLAYSVNTISGASLGERITDLENIINNSSTDIQRMINENENIVFKAGTYIINQTVIVPPNRTISGVFGATIFKASPTLVGDIFRIENKENVLIENIVFKGNLPKYSYSMNGINDGAGIIANENEAYEKKYIGNVNGLYIKKSEKVVLTNVSFIDIEGTALICDEVGKNYIKGFKANNIFIENSYQGIFTTNEHEYSSYDNITISLCQIGCNIDTGNLSFSNPIITRCRVALIFSAGLNNAHGIVSDVEIKHNQIAGILFKDIQNGQIVSGSIQYSNIVLDNCSGIVFPYLFFSNGIINNAGGSSAGKNFMKLFKKGSTEVYNSGNMILEEVDLNS